VTRCASLYGFDSNEALAKLNLENLSIQVREMKKRSSGKKTKAEKAENAEKTEKPVKEKAVKEKKAKPVKVVAYKPSIPLPFVASMVSEDGCHGLAFNCGLFTQCQKMRMSSGSYCKGCQSEADFNASGAPENGSIEQRLACELMEFRDSKGRKPVAYSKIMEKQHITREEAELEASKLNIEIDELHFAVVEKKVVGKPKATKKTVTVVESAPVEDLFAQLVDEDSENESLDATVLLSDSEEEVDTKDQEKAERDMMKEADSESKQIEKALKKQQQAEAKAEELALKKQQQEAEKAQKKIDEQLAKEAKIAADLLAKEQKKIDELAAKEQKKIDELAAKEQKKIDELAAKAAKEQKLIDDKLAKEKKIADEKAAKEQKIIDDKLAKEAKIAADLAAKEQKKIDELAAKEAKKLQLEQEKAAKEQKLIDDKAAKEAKIAADLLAKEEKIAADLAAKEAKKLQLEQEKAAKEAKKLQLESEKAAKAEPKKQKEGTRTIVATKANFKVGDKVEYRSAKGEVSKGTVSEVKMGKSFVEYALQMEDGTCMPNAPEGNVMAAKVEAVAAAAPKKVTVKRITIDGKQYLKTAENLLYDPETKEEMGIYDPETNSIKELPDDSDDEVEEDGYTSE
jgi:hypothetical protein